MSIEVRVKGLEDKVQAVVNTLQSINTPTFNSAFGEDNEFVTMKKEMGQMQSLLMQVQNEILNIGTKATVGKLSAKHAAHLKPEVWMNSKSKPFLKFAAQLSDALSMQTIVRQINVSHEIIGRVIMQVWLH